MSTAVVLVMIVMTTVGQSVDVCEYYSSGKAACDGTSLNVAAVLCGDAFDKTQCVTTPTYGFESTRVFFRVSHTGPNLLQAVPPYAHFRQCDRL